MRQDIKRQQAVLIERVLLREICELTDEAMQAAGMIERAASQAALTDSLLYAEQIMADIDVLQYRIEQLRVRAGLYGIRF